MHLGLALLIAGVLATAPPGFAEPPGDLVTFAEKPYLHAASTSTHEEHEATPCGVCGSPRISTTQLVGVMGGRYEFENVDQAYCPVCHVTTLNLERTPRTARFVRLLWWKLPVSREKVVRTPSRYALALHSSSAHPFISMISGLKTENGQVYLVVE